MSTIVVKNLPDHLHERLKQSAQRNHRSMTKEVVHLIAAGLSGEAPSPARPLRPTDGRDALRAALVEQADGSYINVLGIEDESFFSTLDRIRAEASAPDVSQLFGDAP